MLSVPSLGLAPFQRGLSETRKSWKKIKAIGKVETLVWTIDVLSAPFYLNILYILYMRGLSLPCIVLIKRTLKCVVPSPFCFTPFIQFLYFLYFLNSRPWVGKILCPEEWRLHSWCKMGVVIMLSQGKE